MSFNTEKKHEEERLALAEKAAECREYAERVGEDYCHRHVLVMLLAVAAFAMYAALGTAQEEPANVAELRTATARGDSEGEALLGILYATGSGVQQNVAEAVRWLSRAAEDGHAVAVALIGASVSLDDVFKYTPEQLRRAAEKAKEAGNNEAVEYYEKRAERAEASLEIVQFLRRAVEQGNATAQALLGRIGMLRKDDEADDDEAEKWIRRAAEQGDAWGSYYLGLMYYKGLGVEEKTQEAIRLWKQAADGGLSRGAAEIGLVYLRGIDVEQDEEEATRWYRRASELDYLDTNIQGTHEAACPGAGQGEVGLSVGSMEQLFANVELADAAEVARIRLDAEEGNVDAQFMMGMVAGDKTPEEMAAATRWFRLAAEQGHVLAQWLLGAAYGPGEGGAIDSAESVRWFRCAESQLRAAAERSNPDAQYSLGFTYENGQGVLKNVLEAERWYLMAARQGHVYAQAKLGNIYETGRIRDGISKNLTAAAEWHLRASKQGDSTSQRYLGRMYLLGRGVEEDHFEAVRWLRMAADQGNDFARNDLNGIQIWRCFKAYDSEKATLFKLSRFESPPSLRERGQVMVRTVTHSAKSQINGLNLRWDFGPDGDDSYGYAFVIEPDGTGLYYDFSGSTDGTAKPRQVFDCELSP